LQPPLASLTSPHHREHENRRYGCIAQQLPQLGLCCDCHIQTLRRTRDLPLPGLLSGRMEPASVSANGALSNQPGATPQVINPRIS